MPDTHTAAENLVGYSTAQPVLFKRNTFEPLTDLKLLVKDYPPIARDALTMLVNLSGEDMEVLNLLSTDEAFLETILSRVTSQKEANADLFAMLLANMSKHDSFRRVLALRRDVPKPLSTSPFAVDQLLDLFVKGAEGSYNEKANFDYLCYVFADLSKYEEGRKYFLAPRAEDENIIPLSKVIVFTETKSTIRRRGVASTIKNCSFDTEVHEPLIADPSTADNALGLLPYILLPLMGPEEYSDEDTEGMLDELQLLPPGKEREPQHDITKIHLDTLMLLTTTRPGRDRLREVKVYPVVRELHLQTEDDEVREYCDRLVQVIMRDEEGEGEDAPEPPKLQEVDEEDEMVEIA